MRIIGFSTKWAKLSKPITKPFTTFRFPWSNGFEFQIGDKVQLVFKPRSKDREVLGIAEIVGKEERYFLDITNLEAIEDGFENWLEMSGWLQTQYSWATLVDKPMIKYTLKWRVRN